MRRKKDDKEGFIGKKEIEAKRKEAAAKKKQLEKIKKKKLKEEEKNNKKNDKLKRQKQKEEKLKEKQIKEIKRLKADPDRPLRIKKYKRITKYFLLVLVLLIAFIVFLMTPVFQIKTVEIEGCNRVSEQEVRNLINIGENANLYRVTNFKINRELKENRYIESVKVKRIIPSTLKIIIKERTVNYLFKTEQGYVCVDNYGYVLDVVDEPIEGVLKVYGYKTPQEEIVVGERINQEDIDNFETIYAIKKTAENNEIAGVFSAVDISNDEDYIMYLESENKRVHLGGKNNLDIKMPFVKKIMAKEAGRSGEIHVEVDLNKKPPFFREDV